MAEKKSNPIVIKSPEKVLIDHDLPLSPAAFELAKLVSHLVESGVIRREWYSDDLELAVLVMNFTQDCDEVIQKFLIKRALSLKLSGRWDSPPLVSGNGLAWLAGSLVKAKITTAADVGGDLRKLAEKALQFCVTCDAACNGRNLYAKKDFERNHGLGSRLNPFRKSGRVPLDMILECAGLANSTLINEFKAEGVTTVWGNLSEAERVEQMFRYLTRYPVDMQWDELDPETGLAREWSGEAKVGDEDAINAMVADGVPYDDVHRVVECLKLAKKQKELNQKQRNGVAVAAKKKSQKVKNQT
jgi:hypothetical protein